MSLRFVASSLELWLALASTPGLSRRTLHRLRERYGEPSDIFGRPAAELRALAPPAVCDQLQAGPDPRRPQALAARVRELGARVLLFGDPEFPAWLRSIPDPPVLLFARGELPLEPGVAIVGARKATARGRRVAQSLASAASGAGISVVSGLAYGIDAAAHLGALEGTGYGTSGARRPAGGPVAGVRERRRPKACGAGLAVWASGFDLPAPRGNAGLGRRLLAAGGGWISEYPPGQPARPHHFPERNRLISGLARATLVVEAELPSGSLWTARHALDQGREVWAVPGPVDTAVCAGSNGLLRDGAAPILEPADLLGFFGRSLPSPAAADRSAPPVGSPEALVWQALEGGPEQLDQLARTTGLDASVLGRALVELELAGHVARTGSLIARVSPSARTTS